MAKFFSQIVYGIKGGLNLANVVESKVSSKTAFTPNFNTGAFLISPISNKISIATEIMLSVKGGSFPSDSSSGSSTLRLSYISLPVLFSYKLHNKLSLEVGPEFNYLISAKSKNGNDLIDVGWIWNNKFDVCIDVGLSYKINPRLSASLRYSYGLNGIIK